MKKLIYCLALAASLNSGGCLQQNATEIKQQNLGQTSNLSNQVNEEVVENFREFMYKKGGIKGDMDSDGNGVPEDFMRFFTDRKGNVVYIEIYHKDENGRQREHPYWVGGRCLDGKCRGYYDDNEDGRFDRLDPKELELKLNSEKREERKCPPRGNTISKL